MEKPTLFHPW